ncbi:threonine--tRNA ligase 1, cytoplasmic-like [Gambusia affinis]|uniref:threonine--tRNA ligase 1, cytoplasmic-like n=1 Tax=Gambusia affinis TaxID=33528 RepID=UPI001CDD4E09|nr:threonine--tRNA ligase 1, cytoplasmic-like [Gambusia affinis]
MAVAQLLKLLLQLSPALSERLRVFESLREQSDKNRRREVRESPLSVRLTNGQTVKATAGVTTPHYVAQSLRVKGALVCKVNGELWELGRPLEADCELQLLGFDSAEGRQAAWRTGACVLGSVLEGVFGAEVCREGASELGLFCDHVPSSSSLSLSDVEAKCKEAAALKLPLIGLNMNTEELHELFQLSSITVSNQSDSSGLTRLLGVAFPGEKDRQEWEREQEEARRRDHRRIGTDQELFFFNDVSPGSCFFLPKGAHIYNTLTDFIKFMTLKIYECVSVSEYRRRGFTEVVTPTLYSTALWERSGHWEHYSENMFTVTSEGAQTFALKPMNCPAHCLMFEHRVRSWRELPLRWADFGALHRNELSGALGGLTRVRRFCQDDAHIFCTPEQLEQEIVACLDFVRSVYQVFGFSFHCLLSTRPTPCLGEPEQWNHAEQSSRVFVSEQQLEKSLQQFAERWELNPGDGAFYGPKIDIQIKDAIGRQHQCATIQLDFQLPIRFNLQYVGRDGKLHRPVMIHRAVLGSLERMIAILAENFGGKW